MSQGPGICISNSPYTLILWSGLGNAGQLQLSCVLAGPEGKCILRSHSVCWWQIYLEGPHLLTFRPLTTLHCKRSLSVSTFQGSTQQLFVKGNFYKNESCEYCISDRLPSISWNVFLGITLGYALGSKELLSHGAVVF